MAMEIEFLDAAGDALRTYKQEAGLGLEHHLEDLISNIGSEVFALLPPEQPIDRETSADYLQRYLSALEEKIAAVCRPRSWYLMLFLSRRAPVDQLRFT